MLCSACDGAAVYPFVYFFFAGTLRCFWLIMRLRQEEAHRRPDLSNNVEAARLQIPPFTC